MAYTLFRAIAGVALRWFYRSIEVHGVDRIPRGSPVLFVVNHPNALVDALIVVWIAPRRVWITAKATLFEHPLLGPLLSWFGVLPLRRASDARGRRDDADPARNRETFRAVNAALAARRAILVFPEGKSHDDPFLAPLKTGAARMALNARDSGDAPGLVIVPIGLTFERKDAPRSRVFVQVGEPLPVDEWRQPSHQRPIEALTAEIDARLRAVTLNYSSVNDAARATALSGVIAALVTDAVPLGKSDRPLGVEARIARRLGALNVELSTARPALRKRADDLVRRLDAYRHTVAAHGIRIEDVGISVSRRDGARFVAREAWIFVVAGPLALWGRLNHWLPFHAARLVAMRSVESAADPAMRTIVAGAAIVLTAYMAQGVAVALLTGPLVATAYLLSLPIAAEVNFYSSERLARAIRRARAFLKFRRNPEVHGSLLSELSSLRNDTLALDTDLRASMAKTGG